MNTDTPETDAQHLQFAMGGLTLDFCRKLERERDKARQALAENTVKAERERDEARDSLASAIKQCRDAIDHAFPYS